MDSLSGLKIVQLARIETIPHRAILLSGLGATVLRIDRRQPSYLGVKKLLKTEDCPI